MMNMKTYAFCPVSDQKINEKTARFSAFFTILVLVIFALTQSIYLLAFLGLDFMLRAGKWCRYSPVANLSGLLVRALELDPSWVNAGPKLFAARIGTLLVLGAIFSMAYSSFVSALILAGILTLFAFLEGVFGICVACIIYPYAYKLSYRRNTLSAEKGITKK